MEKLEDFGCFLTGLNATKTVSILWKVSAWNKSVKNRKSDGANCSSSRRSQERKSARQTETIDEFKTCLLNQCCTFNPFLWETVEENGFIHFPVSGNQRCNCPTNCCVVRVLSPLITLLYSLYVKPRLMNLKMQLRHFWWLIDENMNWNIEIQELIVCWRDTVKKKRSNSDGKQSVNMEVVKNKI